MTDNSDDHDLPELTTPDPMTPKRRALIDGMVIPASSSPRPPSRPG